MHNRYYQTDVPSFLFIKQGMSVLYLLRTDNSSFPQAGQSKRIWNELYKVIDSSDVVVQVLDARNPMGTRSTLVEKYLRTETPHKHLVFVLNKASYIILSLPPSESHLLSHVFHHYFLHQLESIFENCKEICRRKQVKWLT